MGLSAFHSHLIAGGVVNNSGVPGFMKIRVITLSRFLLCMLALPH